MGKFEILLVWWNLTVLFLRVTSGFMVGGDPNRRADYLDPDRRYHLEWQVDWEENRITFNVTVKTGGWILFGLANNAEEGTGKDIVIGGVLGGSGKFYFSDRHQEGNRSWAVLDKHQDYKLEQAWESRTETFLSFSRILDTCDPEDYPITENKVEVIWAYGDGDNYDQGYHRQSGSYQVYLLEPEYTPEILRDSSGNPKLLGAQKDLKLWTISIQTRMPSSSTSYLCTIHKAPRLHRKHHIVGFDIHLPDNLSLQHIHHFTTFRCIAPPSYNIKSLFDRFADVSGGGQSCYFPSRPSPNSAQAPLHFCFELHSGWAIGGRAFFFPPEAGLPLGESLDEYYMVQVHYDNPHHLRNVDTTVRMDVWYTPQLRLNDAGFFGMGIESFSLPPTIAVPPQSTNHRTFGHCSGACTSRMFPPEGITVFAALTHSHNSGSRMRLRHFDMEKQVELPWISYDDNYSNRFQQFRHLRENVKILPGDQVTMECTYDNTWTNGSVIGGFTTGHEMCIGFLFYYGRVDYSWCRSQIVSEEGRRRWLGGTENATWDEDQINWVATSPRRLAGVPITEIMDGMRWSEKEREELQRYHLTTPAVGACNKDLSARSEKSVEIILEIMKQLPIAYPQIEVETEDDFSGLVGYPFEAKAYVPPERNRCPASLYRG